MLIPTVTNVINDDGVYTVYVQIQDETGKVLTRSTAITATTGEELKEKIRPVLQRYLTKQALQDALLELASGYVSELGSEVYINPQSTGIDLETVMAFGTVIYICDDKPTTLTEASTTFKLASAAVSPGDYTVTDEGLDGPTEIKIGMIDGITVTAAGKPTYAALCGASQFGVASAAVSLNPLEVDDVINIPGWTIRSI